MKKAISLFLLTAIVIISTIIILGWDYNKPEYYNKYEWKACGDGIIKNDIISFNNTRSTLTTKWPKIYDNDELAGYMLFCYDGNMWIYSCREEGRSHKGFGKYRSIVYAGENLEGLQRINPNHVFEVVDEMPTFPTGFSDLQDYIRKNRATSLITNSAKPYKVILEVVIEKDGSITNAKIKSSIDSLHDEDALRIIGEMPNWKPAKHNGKTVRCKMFIPISYSDQGSRGL